MSPPNLVTSTARFQWAVAECFFKRKLRNRMLRRPGRMVSVEVFQQHTCSLTFVTHLQNCVITRIITATRKYGISITSHADKTPDAAQ